MECKGCGACCDAGFSVDVAGGNVPEEMTQEGEAPWGYGVLWRRMKRTPGGACVALDPDTKLCTLYAARPTVCKEFGPRESLCTHARQQNKGD